MTGRDLITRYFDADARHDHEAIVGLFADDAEVVDEGERWRGVGRIREWRAGPVSRYEYSTEVFTTERTGDDEYLVTGRLTGNFPGGTADLTWRFTLAGDRVAKLLIGG